MNFAYNFSRNLKLFHINLGGIRRCEPIYVIFSSHTYELVYKLKYETCCESDIACPQDTLLIWEILLRSCGPI